MRIDPSTPVVVGVGQVTNRPGTEGDGTLADRPEPVTLMAAAVHAAAEDCDGVAPGGAAPAGRRLLGQVGSLRATDPLSWRYADVGALLADTLGLAPAEVLVATTGGNSPQALVNATALAIGRGEVDVALVVSGDCHWTQAAARRHPDRPLLPWTVQAADTAPPQRFGSDLAGTTQAEERRGLDVPTTIFPLFENALRARDERSLPDHLARIGGLWARASEVAEGNPYAWLRQARTAQELTTPDEGNRMVTYPYTKLLTANLQVDQGAAVLLCSAAAADAAGVPRDRWVFPLAGADAEDHWFLSHRADFHSSPAIRLTGRAALGLAGAGIDDVAHIDLYSCFPSAVQIAAEELGIDLGQPGAPGREWTVTGGLTFAGGPGSGYGTHALATVVGRLRADPSSLALTTGLGWFLSKHSIGIYGTEPGRPQAPVAAALAEDGAEVQEAAGFAWAGPQAAVSAQPQCATDAGAAGEAVVETYAVTFARTGEPARAVVACRTPEGRRTWAQTTEADQLELLVTEEGCGRLATLDGEGGVDVS